MLLFLLACAEEPAGATKSGKTEADQFGGAAAVRVESPSNGETVPTTFTVSYRAGRDVEALSLAADGAAVVSLDSLAEAEGEMVVTLPEGKVELVLSGLDAEGALLSEDRLTVRVSDGEQWVSITSPADGANVANPVTFTVASGADIGSVELLADGWPIGTVDTTGDGEGQLTYSFSGTGYAREITALSADGTASDTLGITVEPEETPEVSDFNSVVMKYLSTYPTDGTNGYYWPSGSDWSGTTRDIWYQDVLVAEGDPQGRCYCVGLTWEVYMRAWEEVDRTTGGDGSINGLGVDDLYTFRVDWFVRELDGPGPSFAMENYGVGEEITDPAKLLPGDFLQFWRHSGSGHNVIFVDWVKQGGEIVGFDYWSTQGSTDGVAYNTEYFGSSGSSVDPNLLYAGRGAMPLDWVGWR